MKKLCILKIGGSVATHKNSNEMKIRRKLLHDIFKRIAKVRRIDPKINIILIHGGGGGTHYLAHKYRLSEGLRAHKDGHKGALLTRAATRELNSTIMSIGLKEKVPLMAVHTGSVLTQDDGKIDAFDIELVMHALKNSFIPVLYGEMVFDSKLGMSVCSGDHIAAYLAHELPITRIFFATDVNGIYTDNPHLYSDVELIEELSMRDALRGEVNLGGSHTVDVTDGLKGKIESCKQVLNNTDVKQLHIFNGFEPLYFEKVLTGRDFPHTIVKA